MRAQASIVLFLKASSGPSIFVLQFNFVLYSSNQPQAGKLSMCYMTAMGSLMAGDMLKLPIPCGGNVAESVLSVLA